MEPISLPVSSAVGDSLSMPAYAGGLGTRLSGAERRIGDRRTCSASGSYASLYTDKDEWPGGSSGGASGTSTTRAGYPWTCD